MNDPASTKGDCPRIAGCGMFRLFTLTATLNSFKIIYCTSDYGRCERYQRVLRGSPVPDNLMPNGELLRKP